MVISYVSGKLAAINFYRQDFLLSLWYNFPEVMQMEWLEKMNDALQYIEVHMEEKINYQKAAEVACCSLSRFQRMFTFVTDTTLAEYVRCRRMALAAKDLLNSDIKVIDLAQKYCYESPEAFTRAYQVFHGVSPTVTRKSGTYTDYPRISFQIKVTGGNFNLGRKPLVRIEDHSRERVVSFGVNCKGPEEAAGNLLREWAVKNLNDYVARRMIGFAPKGHHTEGEEHTPNEETGFHEYVLQLFLVGDEGMEDSYLSACVCDAPQGLYLVGDVALNEFQDNGTIDIGSSMQTAFGVMSECLKDMGSYDFDFNERKHREEQIFSQEWWENPAIGDTGLIGFKLWLPIKKITG